MKKMILVLTVLAGFRALAQQPATTTPVNTFLREQFPAMEHWDIGGQLRARLESKEYYATPGTPAVDFQHIGGNPDNTYMLFREKFHVGYQATDWLKIFGEARDSRSWDDDRQPNPETDPLDLQQAYILLGNPKQFPVTLKIGRQELSYGDERLIGASDWNNLGRVFDAAKVRFENSNFWVDAFVSRIVLPNPHGFNEANDYDFFSGIYASTRTLVPKIEAQAYFLSRNVSVKSPAAIGTGLPSFMTGASARDIYTIGMRVKSLPGEFGAWDYDSEIAGQTGNFKAKSGKRLEQAAYAAHIAGGYTFTNSFGKPRVGLEYNYASGDSNPNDNTHGTFDSLFPTGHKFYGHMDFVSWQNIHNARFTSSWRPVRDLILTADFHGFWLANNNDFFYQVSGTPRDKGGYGINPRAGSYIGSEIDLIANYTLYKWMNLQAGYGHFFVGDYVKNTLANHGGSHDADWFYLQAVLNF